MYENHQIAFGTASFGDQNSANSYCQDDIKEAQLALETVIELNINYIDTADIYGKGRSENIIGELIKNQKKLRDQIVLQSKCGIKFSEENQNLYYDTSKDHIICAVEQSLSRMNTDRLDFLLLHRPDPLMDPEEVSKAFEQLHFQGKVLHFGVSNFTPNQIKILKKFLTVPIVVNQIQFSLLHTVLLDAGIEGFHETINPHGAQGTLEYCKINNIRIQAWSPLKRGVLTGNNMIQDDLILDSQLNKTKMVLYKTSKQYNTSPEALLIAWILKHPYKILPILGSTDPETLKACAAAREINLLREDWFNLYRVARNKDFP